MTDYLTLGNDGRLVDREGKTLELKRNLSSPTGPLRTITAFANSAGGRLVIGIADDGTVVGVEDPLSEEERVDEIARMQSGSQLSQVSRAAARALLDSVKD